ncbi:MAG: YceI family protein [Cyclobacteriaceae bacterium]|nr:YceI family protein [Cyclobacteriaceae bacterium]
MKKQFLLAAFVLVAAFAQAQTWSLDKAHSKLGFGITHLSISNVEGSFKKFDAKITSSKEDFSDATVDVSAEVASVDTDNDQRDEHLRSADYFDAAKFPTLTFKSKTWKKVADKKFKVTGDLTFHGVTKTVELDVTLNGTMVHPMSKKTVAGFKATGVIKRTDFGISPNTPSAMLGDDITLAINTEFAKD